MTSYRFCRPDDILLLVEAVNSCVGRITIQDFKKNVRELNLWASSCMVALDEDNKPIGICVGAKRKTETLIYQIGIHPKHQRKGHGTHMLSSLKQKLAVLGPPRIVAEVPASNDVMIKIFESLEYTREKSLYDFQLKKSLAPLASEDMMMPITLSDVWEMIAEPGKDVCWERDPETLKNRSQEIKGFAVASVDRLDSFLLFRFNPETKINEIVFLHGHRLIEILLRYLSHNSPLPIMIPKLSSDEISFEQIQSMGFKKETEYIRYSVVASDGSG